MGDLAEREWEFMEEGVGEWRRGGACEGGSEVFGAGGGLRRGSEVLGAGEYWIRGSWKWGEVRSADAWRGG